MNLKDTTIRLYLQNKADPLRSFFKRLSDSTQHFSTDADSMRDLLDVILRFRWHAVSDVNEAFSSFVLSLVTHDPSQCYRVLSALLIKLREMLPAERERDPVYHVLETEEARLSLGYPILVEPVASNEDGRTVTVRLLESLFRHCPIALKEFERAVKVTTPPVSAPAECLTTLAAGLLDLARVRPALTAFVIDHLFAISVALDARADADIVFEEDSDDELSDDDHTEHRLITGESPAFSSYTERSLATVHPSQPAEAEHTAHIAARAVDGIVVLICHFISDVLPPLLAADAASSTPADDTRSKSASFFLCLTSALSAHVLRVRSARFAQFPVFYACSFSAQLSSLFVTILCQTVLDPIASPEVRISTASYLASFCARAAFLSESAVLSVVDVLVDMASMALDVGTHVAVVQAIVYIITFRSTLFVIRSPLTGELMPSPVARQLDLRSVFDHPSRPLAGVAEVVISEFVALCEMSGLYCGMRELYRKQKAAGDLCEEMAVFPFDPYFLGGGASLFGSLVLSYAGLPEVW